MEIFTIKEILETKINSLKNTSFEDVTYKKVQLLFKIWQKQEELLYLFDIYEALEEEKTSKPIIYERYDKAGSYHDQYISFLMKCDLIFLEEVKEEKTLIQLIYYWLISNVRRSKILLDKN